MKFLRNPSNPTDFDQSSFKIWTKSEHILLILLLITFGSLSLEGCIHNPSKSSGNPSDSDRSNSKGISSDFERTVLASREVLQTVEDTVLSAYKNKLISYEDSVAFGKIDSKAVQSYNTVVRVLALADSNPSDVVLQKQLTSEVDKYTSILLDLVNLLDSFGIDIPPEIDTILRILRDQF